MKETEFAKLVLPLVFAGVLLALSTPSVHANVFASNIKLNGALTNVTASAGPVNISYILNEPASAGVAVKILSNSTPVRLLEFSTGAEGTKRGTNTIVWDGKDTTGNLVAVGTYGVSITAASQGYNVWTTTTDDTNDGNNVWEGRGIAVDRNTNSPYYGRILVSNSQVSDPAGHNWLGYQVGILKCNADGSYADEGGFSTGGHAWAGDLYSPWHVRISADDFVYVNDWTGSGEIFRWEPTLSTTSLVHVLRPDNWAPSGTSVVNLSGPGIFGTGTNTFIWMADITWPNGLGVLKFNVGTDGTCAQNDTGTLVVADGGDLSLYPYAVDLDSQGNIYTAQYRANVGDPSYRVLRFPAYDPATNGMAPEYTADWAIGGADDTLGRVMEVSVDPTDTYVAVAARGASTTTLGCTQIFYATNGALVTNLDLNITISGNSQHSDTGCAWDAVGNVYYIDNYYGCWRAVSPPGTNASTTVAIPKVQIAAVVQPPQITVITISSGTATINFTGAAGDPASAYTLLSASTVNGAYTTATGATVTLVSPGLFRATVPTSGPAQFYRIQR